LGAREIDRTAQCSDRAVRPCGSGARPSSRRRAPPKFHVGHGLRHALRAQVSNPAADAGHRQSQRAQGRQRPHSARRGPYDSLHPFVLKGVAGRRHHPALGDARLLAGRATRPFTVLRHARRNDRGAAGPVAGTAFTLRPQARWHDGSPITVEDVIWSFDYAQVQGSADVTRPITPTCWKAEKNQRERKVLSTFRAMPRNRELRADPRPVGQSCRRRWWASRRLREVVTRGRVVRAGAYKVDGLRSSADRSPIAASPDWWGQGPLDEPRHGTTFETMRYEYYRDAEVTFESLQGRRDRHPAARTPAATG
jgi:hypothetical protein